MSRCSIIIPTKDRPLMLVACLEAMREAKGPDDEVLVIDSSTDGHTGFVAQLSGVVDRYWHKDVSAVEATNFGVQEARGRYIKVFADDDFINGAGHLKSLDIADKHEDVEMFLCGGVKIRTDMSKVTVVCYAEDAKVGHTVESIISAGAFGGGQLIRRHVFEKAGMYSHIRICDQEFATRCVAKGVKVRHMRVNTYLHPLYPHSGLVSKMDETNTEFKALAAQYGVRVMKRIECLFPPIWDGAVI